MNCTVFGENKMKYTEMKLGAPIQRAIQEIGFDEPTPIQEQAIPFILDGRDVLGQSETGSGKTAAFGLPILEKIEPFKGVQALILAPTRELAEQIYKSLESFSKYKKCKVITVYGGVGIMPQVRNIERADIVVGTPGRTLYHLREQNLDLSRVKFLVLDEADKMFEMGFIDDVEEIIDYAPKEKQFIMFSATMERELDHIVKRRMHNVARVKTSTHVSSSNLKQIYYNVKRQEKFSLLVHMLKEEKPELALVFCSTRDETHSIARNLGMQGIKASELHGGLSQNKRTYVMEEFRDKKINVLVASDVAARGLDIKHLTHIINYSIPKTPKEYLHRIGRTARIGHAGIAISLLDERDHDNFRRVLSDRSLKIEKRETPVFEKAPMQFFRHEDENRRPFRRGGFRGGGSRGGGEGRRPFRSHSEGGFRR